MAQPVMTQHTHHFIPRRTGRYNRYHEPIQEMRCDCGERPADEAKRALGHAT